MADKFHLPIDDMLDLAAALGRLLVHWSFLEVMLIQLTAYILTVDVYKAQFIYREFISTRSKISLLRKINDKCAPDASVKENIEKYLEKALKLNKKRNDIVHAFWVVSEDTLGMVNTSPHNKGNGIPIKVTPKHIQNVVEEIASLSRSLLLLLFPNAKVPTK